MEKQLQTTINNENNSIEKNELSVIIEMQMKKITELTEEIDKIKNKNNEMMKDIKRIFEITGICSKCRWTRLQMKEYYYPPQYECPSCDKNVDFSSDDEAGGETGFGLYD